MEVTIRVAAADAETELRSLRDWLATEDELRGRVALRSTTPRPGEMGAVVDVLTVAVGAGGAATVLAGALTTWLRTRRSDLTVEVTDTEQGRTVKLTGSNIKDPEALVREVLGPTDG
jgi:membrane-associated two-gene conflict system component 1 (EACC1)